MIKGGLKSAIAVDISFNAIGFDRVQNLRSVTMKVEDFTNLVTTAMRTQFLAATAAA